MNSADICWALCRIQLWLGTVLSRSSVFSWFTSHNCHNRKTEEVFQVHQLENLLLSSACFLLKILVDLVFSHFIQGYIALWLVSFPPPHRLSSTPLQSLTTLLFSTSHYLTSVALALINDTLNLTRITCVTTGLCSSKSPGFNCDDATTEDSECHSFRTHHQPVIQP